MLAPEGPWDFIRKSGDLRIYELGSVTFNHLGRLKVPDDIMLSFVQNVLPRTLREVNFYNIRTKPTRFENIMKWTVTLLQKVTGTVTFYNHNFTCDGLISAITACKDCNRLNIHGCFVERKTEFSGFDQMDNCKLKILDITGTMLILNNYRSRIPKIQKFYPALCESKLQESLQVIYISEETLDPKVEKLVKTFMDKNNGIRMEISDRDHDFRT